MSLSPDQIAQRKTGITAADVAAIAGLSPYRSAIDVWLEKTNRAAPFTGNERTRWGQILEIPIREDYAQRHGVRVEVPGTLEHSLVPWAKATPDGICYLPGRAEPTCGLEIKTHSFRVADQYGDPGTDQVPPHELAQVAWSLFVTGLDRWSLVAFIDGQPAEYRIERDDELIEMLATDAERFLMDHVRKDVPPEPDGSASYTRYLSTTYPQRLPDLLPLDDKPEALALVQRLRLARNHHAQFETEVEILVQNLKAVCGGHAGLSWADPDAAKGRAAITYRRSQDGTKTDWQAAWRSLVTEAQIALSADQYDVEPLARALMNISDENRSIATYTHSVAGNRPFITPKIWKAA